MVQTPLLLRPAPRTLAPTPLQRARQTPQLPQLPCLVRRRRERKWPVSPPKPQTQALQQRERWPRIQTLPQQARQQRGLRKQVLMQQEHQKQAQMLLVRRKQVLKLRGHQKQASTPLPALPQTLVRLPKQRAQQRRTQTPAQPQSLPQLGHQTLVRSWPLQQPQTQRKEHSLLRVLGRQRRACSPPPLLLPRIQTQALRLLQLAPQTQVPVLLELRRRASRLGLPLRQRQRRVWERSRKALEASRTQVLPRRGLRRQGQQLVLLPRGRRRRRILSHRQLRRRPLRHRS